MSEPGRGNGSLEGRAALVTGASRGIGRAVALEVAARGAAVVVNYVSREADAEAVVAEIRQAGGSAHARRADVSDPSQVAELVVDVREQLVRGVLVPFAEGREQGCDVLGCHAGPLPRTSAAPAPGAWRASVPGPAASAPAAASHPRPGPAYMCRYMTDP